MSLPVTLAGADAASSSQPSPPVVFVGCDTRPSSQALAALTVQAAAAIGATVYDYGKLYV